MVRDRARAKQYKFTWVKTGKLFAKKSESSPVVRIYRIADLEKIVEFVSLLNGLKTRRDNHHFEKWKYSFIDVQSFLLFNVS